MRQMGRGTASLCPYQEIMCRKHYFNWYNVVHYQIQAAWALLDASSYRKGINIAFY
ncbi:hypothetical protein NIES4075_55690 [Tolypothrix sp. NIES-4075]|nr:hypothetical protein NIES4075_55690 [Tolypothrix sp. NIES-4075]